MEKKVKLITLRNVETEAVSWLWEPYIALGKICLCQGDGGDGKTTLTLAIAAAISKGDALPGCTGGAPAHVIVHNSEDGLRDTITPRLKRFGADIDRVHFIDDEDDPLTFVDERLEQAIIEKGAKLLILDPVQAYFGRSNMNAAGSVRPVMKRLGQVAARNNCAIMLVGHLGKKGGKATYRGLGSVDIYAAARSVLTVGRLEMDDNMRAFVQIKNNLAPIGSPQAFGLDDAGTFCWLGECDATIDEFDGKKQPPPTDKFAAARRFIESTLAKGPAPAVDMIERAEELGISEKTLKRAKSALGVISVKRNGKWYWEMPIEVEYYEVGQEVGHQGGHDGGQTGHAPMASLLLTARNEVVV